MKNIVIQFYDKNEQFETFCDSNTTPMILANFIQDANYYENFNLSEIFYFKIKDTELYFGHRNTPIYKYINNMDNPTLIFYRGLNGQQNLKSCKKIEDSQNQTDNIKDHNQKEILNGKVLSNAWNSNQFEQSSFAKSQQPQQKKILISEITAKDHLKQGVFQNNDLQRLTEEYFNRANYGYFQAQNSVILQKVNEKPNNFLDQYFGAVNSEIQGSHLYSRLSQIKQPQIPSNQQKNEQLQKNIESQPRSGSMKNIQNQKKTKSQKKAKYLISVEASKDQLQILSNFMKTNNIQYTCDKQYNCKID